MEKMTRITFKLHRQALLSVSTISLKHNIDYFPTTNLSLVGRDVNHAGFELPGSVDASEEVGWCWDSGQLRRDPPHPSHQALQENSLLLTTQWINMLSGSWCFEYITYLVFCRVCWVLILCGRKIQSLHLDVSGTNITIQQCIHLLYTDHQWPSCPVQGLGCHPVAPRTPDVGKFGLDEFEMRQMHLLLKKQRPDLFKHIYRKEHKHCHAHLNKPLDSDVLKLGLLRSWWIFKNLKNSLPKNKNFNLLTLMLYSFLPFNKSQWGPMLFWIPLTFILQTKTI